MKFFSCINIKQFPAQQHWWSRVSARFSVVPQLPTKRHQQLSRDCRWYLEQDAYGTLENFLSLLLLFDTTNFLVIAKRNPVLNGRPCVYICGCGCSGWWPLSHSNTTLVRRMGDLNASMHTVTVSNKRGWSGAMAFGQWDSHRLTVDTLGCKEWILKCSTMVIQYIYSYNKGHQAPHTHTLTHRQRGRQTRRTQFSQCE